MGPLGNTNKRHIQFIFFSLDVFEPPTIKFGCSFICQNLWENFKGKKKNGHKTKQNKTGDEMT